MDSESACKTWLIAPFIKFYYYTWSKFVKDSLKNLREAPNEVHLHIYGRREAGFVFGKEG